MASTMFWPCETRTSTCRSFATISSGLYRFLAIAVLLDVKGIPQVGPLQWGWIMVNFTDKGLKGVKDVSNRQDKSRRATRYTESKRKPRACRGFSDQIRNVCPKGVSPMESLT